MKLDAFMQITDANAPGAFKSSLDQDNTDKVEILAFRQSIFRDVDHRGEVPDSITAPKKVLFTVLRTVDKDSDKLLKRVADNAEISVTLFVRAMQYPDPPPVPPVPKYEKDYIKIKVGKARVTRVRIILQSNPASFAILEEIDFTCSSDKIDWKTGKTEVNEQAIIGA